MTGLGHLGLGPLESISTCLERGRVAKLMQPPVLRRAVLGARCDFQLNRPSRVDPQAVAIYSVRHVSQTTCSPPHGLPLSVIVRNCHCSEDGRKEGKMAGRKEGRKKGWNAGWKAGRKAGKKEGWKDGRKEGRKEGRMEGKMDGRKEGWKEGMMEGRREGRKDPNNF